MAGPDAETIFCQVYARNSDALDALATAGITNEDDAQVRYSPRVLAEQLLAREDIQAAIRAFRSIAATVEQIEVTHRSIAADMQAVYDAAMTQKDLKAAISAKTLQANVLGLLEQKIVVTSRKSVEDMTDAELLAIMERSGKLVDVTPSRPDMATDVTPRIENGSDATPAGEGPDAGSGSRGDTAA